MPTNETEIDAQDVGDDSLTDEEDIEWRKRMESFDAAIEAELVECYGPPEVREQMTAKHCADLCERWGEAEIRRLLQRIAEQSDTLAVKMLVAARDLATDPLTAIIRPFDFLGFRLSITPLDEDPEMFEIEFGKSARTVGDGERWLARRVGDSLEEITSARRQWIC